MIEKFSGTRVRIDPKVDFAFKCLFGSEANKDILIGLLRSVLKLDIREVEILNPYNAKDAPDDKLSILDVKARLADGTLINVEMQMVVNADYPERSLYYWAALYTSQLKSGEEYEQLARTVSIHIVNGQLFPGVAGYHQEFEIRAKEHPELRLTDRFSMHTIELAKVKLKVEEVASPLDQWCYFFKHADELEADSMPVTLNDGAVRRAMEALKIMFQTDRERELYLGREKQARDELSRNKSYEKIDAEAKAIAERFEQQSRLFEQQARLVEQQTLRAEQETMRAERQTLRAEQEAARASQAEKALSEGMEKVRSEIERAERAERAQRESMRREIGVTLVERFGPAASSSMARLQGIEDLARLQSLFAAAFRSASLAEFEKLLES